MARRIVVFPVMGRRWAFTGVLPTGGDGKSLPVGSMRDLLNSLRTSAHNGDRAELVTQYFSDKMHETFSAWGATPESSFRSRLHSIGQRMLSRLGPTESFLKAIPKDAGLLEIVHPNCVNPRLVRRRVRHLAMSGEVVHRRYMYGSMALLPFSVLFGVLPLPNVVLAWNLFRAYSHWQAVQGSRRLNFLVSDSSGLVSNAFPTTRGEILSPSELLDALLIPANVPKEAITDATVGEICKQFPLDPLEIMKWRDQKLPIKSFG